MVNFIVLGEIRSGAWAITSTLNTHPRLICHDQIINHPDTQKRVMAHYSYFGHDSTDRPYGYHKYETGPASSVWAHPYYSSKTDPVWVELDPLLGNYIENTLFKTTVNGETHAGARISLKTVEETRIEDVIRNWGIAGTAAIIYVDRNPFDCYVSYQQAKQFSRWASSTKKVCIPVRLDVEECNAFVHKALARRDRLLSTIHQATGDYCLIQYRWLFDREGMIDILADYLRIDAKGFGITDTAAIHPYPVKKRVSNYDILRTKCSSTVRELMDISASEDDIFFSTATNKRMVL